MIIPKKETNLAINGVTKSLKEADFSYEESAARILWIQSPALLPGWSIVFQSSRSRRLTLQHLTLKMLIVKIDNEEKVVLKQLLINLPDDEYQIFEIILSNYSKSWKHRKEILEQFSEFNFLEIENPYRQFRSFDVSLKVFKIWTERKRFPPVPYIGVGYKDHGSLSSNPSWKDQQSFDGDDTTRLDEMLLSIRKIFSESLYRNPFHGLVLPTEELQESETGSKEVKK